MASDSTMQFWRKFAWNNMAYYKTWNAGKQITGGTAEHQKTNMELWQKNGTPRNSVAEQQNTPE